MARQFRRKHLGLRWWPRGCQRRVAAGVGANVSESNYGCVILMLEGAFVMNRFSSRVLIFLVCVLTYGARTWSAERVVDLTAGDGTKLKASYFAAAKPGPGVLLLHQCNRQRKIWDGLGQQLAAVGINVLTLDYRGFGESGGDPFDKLPREQMAQIQAEKWRSDFDT